MILLSLPMRRLFLVKRWRKDGPQRWVKGWHKKIAMNLELLYTMVYKHLPFQVEYPRFFLDPAWQSWRRLRSIEPCMHMPPLMSKWGVPRDQLLHPVFRLCMGDATTTHADIIETHEWPGLSLKSCRHGACFGGVGATQLLHARLLATTTWFCE